MGRTPVAKYNVVRKTADKDGKTVWLKVGHISLWEDGTGKLHLYMFSDEYHIFLDNKPGEKKEQRDE